MNFENNKNSQYIKYWKNYKKKRQIDYNEDYVVIKKESCKPINKLSYFTNAVGAFDETYKILI